MSHQIAKTIQEILEIDTKKIIRQNLGDASLLSFEEELSEILRRVQFISNHYEFVDSGTNNTTKSSLDQIRNYMKALAGYTKEQFVANQAAQVNQIKSNYNNIKKQYGVYAISALDKSGLLETMDFKSEVEKSKETIDEKIKKALEDVKTQSEKIIKAAKEEAKTIEGKVRKTAQNVSFKEAQTQFENAVKKHEKQIRNWVILTFILIGIFVGFIYFLLSAELDEKWTWQVIYFSVIRISILSLIGVILGFSFKMLKAHMHMYQHNLHRKRITNSMATFVESAANEQQRDEILRLLIENVTSFGKSGIISGQEDSTSKISIDNITKSIGGLTG